MALAFDVVIAIRPCLSRGYERNIVELINSSQITLAVTCTTDCTCHHLTNLQKKLKFADTEIASYFFRV